MTFYIMSKLLAKIIVGSQMFGTNDETSDIDIAEIYKCSMDDLLGLKYSEHDDRDKDYRRYEIGKIIKLLMSANPNVLEMLNAPDDCILETSDEWEYLRSVRDMFLTKEIGKTFVGYAKSQIKKANSLNKKMNWDENKICKKSVLDFCFIVEKESTPLTQVLEERGILQQFVGLSKIPNTRGMYNMYVDFNGQEYFKEHGSLEGYQDTTGNVPLGYKGITKLKDGVSVSNQIRLSSIPKKEENFGTLYYNMDGYSAHSKQYTEYIIWLNNRNENRYRINKEHGQMIDGKNLAHNVRLLMTSKDALLGKGLVVRRNDEEVEYLLKIKRGQLDLQQIQDDTVAEIAEIENMIKDSVLPDSLPFDFFHDLLVKLRLM